MGGHWCEAVGGGMNPWLMWLYAHVQTSSLSCRRSICGGSLVFDRRGDNLRSLLAKLTGRTKEFTTTLHRYVHVCTCMCMCVCMCEGFIQGGRKLGPPPGPERNQ